MGTQDCCGHNTRTCQRSIRCHKGPYASGGAGTGLQYVAALVVSPTPVHHVYRYEGVAPGHPNMGIASG